MQAEGRLQVRAVAFDCDDAVALAHFYGRLFDAPVDVDDPDWCEVHLAGPDVKLAFQRVADYRAPDWPDGDPQQVHLDITVSDLAAASERAVALGARVLGPPVDEGDSSTFQVHADPAGHPFCFCQDRQ
jgi:predicted enzyme related to lactoylglutathione lyase